MNHIDLQNEIAAEIAATEMEIKFIKQDLEYVHLLLVDLNQIKVEKIEVEFADAVEAVNGVILTGKTSEDKFYQRAKIVAENIKKLEYRKRALITKYFV